MEVEGGEKLQTDQAEASKPRSVLGQVSFNQGQYQVKCYTTKVSIRSNVIQSKSVYNVTFHKSGPNVIHSRSVFGKMSYLVHLRSVWGQISYNQGLYLGQLFYFDNSDKKCWYFTYVFIIYIDMVFIIAVCALLFAIWTTFIFHLWERKFWDFHEQFMVGNTRVSICPCLWYYFYILLKSKS